MLNDRTLICLLLLAVNYRSRQFQERLAASDKSLRLWKGQASCWRNILMSIVARKKAFENPRNSRNTSSKLHDLTVTNFILEYLPVPSESPSEYHTFIFDSLYWNSWNHKWSRISDVVKTAVQNTSRGAFWEIDSSGRIRVCYNVRFSGVRPFSKPFQCFAFDGWVF